MKQEMVDSRDWILPTHVPTFSSEGSSCRACRLSAEQMWNCARVVCRVIGALHDVLSLARCSALFHSVKRICDQTLCDAMLLFNMALSTQTRDVWRGGGIQRCRIVQACSRRATCK